MKKQEVRVYAAGSISVFQVIEATLSGTPDPGYFILRGPGTEKCLQYNDLDVAKAKADEINASQAHR